MVLSTQRKRNHDSIYTQVQKQPAEIPLFTFFAGFAPPVEDVAVVVVAAVLALALPGVAPPLVALEAAAAFFFLVFFLPGGFDEDFGEVTQRGNSFSISA